MGDRQKVKNFINQLKRKKDIFLEYKKSGNKKLVSEYKKCCVSYINKIVGQLDFIDWSLDSPKSFKNNLFNLDKQIKNFSELINHEA